MPPARRRARVDSPEDRVPTPAPGGEKPTFDGAAPGAFNVQLPGGGELRLNTAEEVAMWNETSGRYIKDYRLSKQNDLIQLGALLTQILMMYRAQVDLADPKKMGSAQEKIAKAAEEIRKAEKALGIDKATREKGGQHTTADYVVRLKRAAHAKGVRLSERMLEYDRVMMEARWKIRLLRNGDKEDRDYHKLSEKGIIDWLEAELGKIEEADKQWAREKGAIFVGKL